MFEKLPNVITGFTALVLSISVTYDFGFFFWYGVSFSEIPTTLSDHLRSSLIWIPSTFFVIFIIIANELISRRIERAHTEEEIIQSSKNPKLLALWRRSPIIPFILLAAFLPFAYFMEIEVPLFGWMFGLITWWFFIHDFSFSHKMVVERTSTNFYFFTRWFPVAAILILFSGAISAQRLPEGEHYYFEIGKSKKEYVIARAYDKYFVLWNVESKTLDFIPSSQVQKYYSKEKI
ncbi:hypothetical protein [Endozoicomonas elysicola]|uniref:Uncharacterized protein n=1 Tax=Endozoicomonas elysicola TaxID=305900 RepID=A0A081K841_9GAMM|nr:hypothetical protein [Endozoicomonas elysicola]KEI70317.1 hypothetical protein GV64_05845 [Endozoicomonas elysicola]